MDRGRKDSPRGDLLSSNCLWDRGLYPKLENISDCPHIRRYAQPHWISIVWIPLVCKSILSFGDQSWNTFRNQAKLEWWITKNNSLFNGLLPKAIITRLRRNCRNSPDLSYWNYWCRLFRLMVPIQIFHLSNSQSSIGPRPFFRHPKLRSNVDP